MFYAQLLGVLDEGIKLLFIQVQPKEIPYQKMAKKFIPYFICADGAIAT